MLVIFAPRNQMPNRSHNDPVIFHQISMLCKLIQFWAYIHESPDAYA